MDQPIKQILLESYDFKKRKKFAIEYSWKAIFRIVPLSKDIPDLLFIAVSENYIRPKGLHVDMVHEVLDVNEVVKTVNLRSQKYLESEDDVSSLDKYFY